MVVMKACMNKQERVLGCLKQHSNRPESMDPMDLSPLCQREKCRLNTPRLPSCTHFPGGRPH